jgi:tetratricopeptide (TPR) repeat protein
MQSLHTDSGSVEKDRMQLSYALAKAYEDLGEFDKSFNYLEQGNRLRHKELNYNISNDIRLVTKIKDIFSAGSLALDVSPGRNNALIHPLFIVGMPRSGTSLAEQILASHSQVYGAGELETMGKLVYLILSDMPDQNVTQDSNKITRNEIYSVRDGYLQALTALGVPEKTVTDKLPLNFLFIGFILSAFPEAKIIHLNRDSRATCWSIYRHYFTGKGNGYAYDMGDLAEFYKLYIGLMSFWRERFSDSIYDLYYEKLTENQEQETRKLLQFCGLQWEEQCLDFHQTKRAVKTASNAQVRKQMYQGSSEAWRKYERHLQPLIKELGY